MGSNFNCRDVVTAGSSTHIETLQCFCTTTVMAMHRWTRESKKLSMLVLGRRHCDGTAKFWSLSTARPRVRKKKLLLIILERRDKCCAVNNSTAGIIKNSNGIPGRNIIFAALSRHPQCSATAVTGPAAQRHSVSRRPAIFISSRLKYTVLGHNSAINKCSLWWSRNPGRQRNE